MIKGYRELSSEEFRTIKHIKELEKSLLKEIKSYLEQNLHDDYIDLRWKSIGMTHLEQGFMALVRSIAKPE